MAANTAGYDRWFAIADSDRDGRVTGKDAVEFFQRSGLPREVLAKVWDLANSNRQGFLDRAAFHKAMDLIAMGQQVRWMTVQGVRCGSSGVVEVAAVLARGNRPMDGVRGVVW